MSSSFPLSANLAGEPSGTVSKLSFTIQLSEPESHADGEVLLYKSLIDTLPESKAGVPQLISVACHSRGQAP
jgi:hypothetical protein